jgi:hypothetical protein
VKRRSVLLAGSVLLGAGLCTIRAHAGSYLDRAALLISEGKHASEFLRRRLYDPELARVVHEGASARVTIASKMLVPEEVVQAHPHLLLVLQHQERAANAAVERAPKEFLHHLGLARDEERVLRAVLKQLGWELPE